MNTCVYKLTVWITLVAFSASQVSALILPPETFADAPLNPSFTIPRELGKETDRWGKLQGNEIIYIQDAHSLAEAQRHIAGLIEHFCRTSGWPRPVVIGMEGASGKIDLDPLEVLNDPAVKEEVTGVYLKKGYLSGAEYAALNFERAELFGLESPDLYEADRAAYLEAYDRRGKGMETAARLEQDLARKKKILYSPELWEIEQQEEKFRKRPSDFLVFYDFLAGKIEPPPELSHLSKLAQARALEKTIDFRLAEEQAERLLRAVSEKKKSGKYLKKWMKAKKYGMFFAFYRRLFGEADKAGLATGEYAELKRYVDYLAVIESIQGPELFDELDRLAALLKENQFLTTEERERDREGEILRAFSKVIQLDAERGDLDLALRAREGGMLPAELVRESGPALKFYELALQRDDALFENLEKAVAEVRSRTGQEPLVFLVTGGFHSRGITARMKQAGHGFRLLSPAIRGAVTDTPYLELMRGKKSPLAPLAEAFAYDAESALSAEARQPVRLQNRTVFYRFKFRPEIFNLPRKKFTASEIISFTTSAAPMTAAGVEAGSGPSGLQSRVRAAVAKGDYPGFKKLVLKQLGGRPRFDLPHHSLDSLNDTILRSAYDSLRTERETFEDFSKEIEALEEEVVARAVEAAELSRRIRAVRAGVKRFSQRITSEWSAEEIGREILNVREGKIGAPGFLADKANVFELIIAYRKAAETRRVLRAASLGEDTHSARSLGRDYGSAGFFEDEFETYFFGQLDEDDLINHLLYGAPLEESLGAIRMMRTRTVYEREAAEAAGYLPGPGGEELPLEYFQMRLAALNRVEDRLLLTSPDPAALEISLDRVFERAERAFDAADYDPDATRHPRDNVTEEGMAKRLALFQAYYRIASEPHWGGRYFDPVRNRGRSLRDPALMIQIRRDDLLGNIVTSRDATIEILEGNWEYLGPEDRRQFLQTVQDSHFNYLVVHRIANEIVRTHEGGFDFGYFTVMGVLLLHQLRRAIDAGDLQLQRDIQEILPYILPPDSREAVDVSFFDIPKIRNLESVFGELYAGKISDDFDPGGEFDMKTATGIFAASALQAIVHVFLYAGLRPGQQVLDLGSGDGRVLLAASYLFGARATGFETDDFIRSASEAAADHFAATAVPQFDRSGVTISSRNFMDEDWSKYDVIFYADHGADAGFDQVFIEKLRTLKPGAIFIVHRDFGQSAHRFPFLHLLETVNVGIRPTRIYRMPEAASLGGLPRSQVQEFNLPEIVRQVERAVYDVNPARDMGQRTDVGTYFPSDLREVATILQNIRQVYPEKLGVLDVGAGDGGVANLAKQMGFQTDAVEFDLDLISMAERIETDLPDAGMPDINWIHDDFFDADLPWENYDIVFYYDRGSDTSRELFERLRQKMKPGALLVVYRQAFFSRGDLERNFAFNHVYSWNFPSTFEGRSWPTHLYMKGSVEAASLGAPALPSLPPFPVEFEEWSWKIAPEANLPKEYLEQSVRDWLSRKELRDAALVKVFGRPVAEGDVQNVRISHIQEGRVGHGEGIFKAAVTLSGGRTGNFILVIPKSAMHSPEIPKIFSNMQTLHSLDAKYVPEPYVVGQGGYQMVDGGDVFPLNMFAIEYLSDFEELNPHDQTTLKINRYPTGTSEILDAESSSAIKRFMIKILTVYYEKNNHQILRDPFTIKELENGPNLKAGDFVKKRDALALQLITARGFLPKEIPDFVYSLIDHEEKDIIIVDEAEDTGFTAVGRGRVFTRAEVYGGIEDGLKEIYGGDRGAEMAREWFAAHEAAYDRPAYIGEDMFRRDADTKMRLIYATEAELDQMGVRLEAVYVDGYLGHAEYAVPGGQKVDVSFSADNALLLREEIAEPIRELIRLVNGPQEGPQPGGSSMGTGVPLRYFAFYKPRDVLSTAADPSGANRRTVFQLLRDAGVDTPDLGVVGRLDYDAQGLMVATNDGSMIGNLILPEGHVVKHYRVKVPGKIEDAQIQELRLGVEISTRDARGFPARERIVPERVESYPQENTSPDGSAVHVYIKEGRYHQVKAMLEAVGHNRVTELERVSIGDLDVNVLGLRPGEVRELKGNDLDILLRARRDAEQKLEQLARLNIGDAIRQYLGLLHNAAPVVVDFAAGRLNALVDREMRSADRKKRSIGVLTSAYKLRDPVVSEFLQVFIPRLAHRYPEAVMHSLVLSLNDGNPNFAAIIQGLIFTILAEARNDRARQEMSRVWEMIYQRGRPDQTVILERLQEVWDRYDRFSSGSSMGEKEVEEYFAHHGDWVTVLNQLETMRLDGAIYGYAISGSLSRGEFEPGLAHDLDIAILPRGRADLFEVAAVVDRQNARFEAGDSVVHLTLEAYGPSYHYRDGQLQFDMVRGRSILEAMLDAGTYKGDRLIIISGVNVTPKLLGEIYKSVRELPPVTPDEARRLLRAPPARPPSAQSVGEYEVTPVLRRLARELGMSVPEDKLPFFALSGLESSDPYVNWRRRDMWVELGHDRHLARDLQLAARARTSIVRVSTGLPKIWRAPGVYDWQRTDEMMAEFRRSRVIPSVDLVHFGLPDWLPGFFQNADFPANLEQFTRDFLARYPDVKIVTPVNEPFVTAFLSAWLGLWNESIRHNPAAFALAIKNIARAAILSSNVIIEENRRTGRDVLLLVNDSAEYWHPHAAQQGTADFYNSIRFALLDLILHGEVRDPLARKFLDENGWTPADHEEFRRIHDAEGMRRYSVLGLDYYPTTEHFMKDDGTHYELNLKTQKDYLGLLAGFYRIGKQYVERYPDYPFLVAETNRPAGQGMLPWMRVMKHWSDQLILDGKPMVGFTWYSVIDQLDWQSALVGFGEGYLVGLVALNRVARRRALNTLILNNDSLRRQSYGQSLGEYSPDWFRAHFPENGDWMTAVFGEMLLRHPESRVWFERITAIKQFRFSRAEITRLATWIRDFRSKPMRDIVFDASNYSDEVIEWAFDFQLSLWEMPAAQEFYDQPHPDIPRRGSWRRALYRQFRAAHPLQKTKGLDFNRYLFLIEHDRQDQVPLAAHAAGSRPAGLTEMLSGRGLPPVDLEFRAVNSYANVWTIFAVPADAALRSEMKGLIEKAYPQRMQYFDNIPGLVFARLYFADNKALVMNVQPNFIVRSGHPDKGAWDQRVQAALLSLLWVLEHDLSRLQGQSVRDLYFSTPGYHLETANLSEERLALSTSTAVRHYWDLPAAAGGYTLLDRVPAHFRTGWTPQPLLYLHKNLAPGAVSAAPQLQAASLGGDSGELKLFQGNTLLEGLRILSSEARNAAEKAGGEPVTIMITGRTATFKTELTKMMAKTGFADFLPEDIDYIGTDDLTEGEMQGWEKLTFPFDRELELFNDFLRRRKPDGSPFKVKLVEGYHAPMFFAEAGVRPQIGVVLESRDFVRFIRDGIRYWFLGPLFVINFILMRNQDPEAEFGALPPPLLSSIRIRNNEFFMQIRRDLRRRYAAPGKRLTESDIAGVSAKEGIAPALLREILHLPAPAPQAQSMGQSVPAGQPVDLTGSIRIFDPAAGTTEVGAVSRVLHEALALWGPDRFRDEINTAADRYIQTLRRTREQTGSRPRGAEIRPAVRRINAILFDDSLTVEERDRRINALLADIVPGREGRELRRFFVYLDRTLGVLHPQWPVRLTRAEARLKDKNLFSQTSGGAARTFLESAFPAESALAVIFGVSDPQAPYSLADTGYRETVRMVLTRNPLAVVRLVHLGSPAETDIFKRQFASFGSRFDIRSASKEEAPYALAGFIGDSLTNEVKMLTGNTALKAIDLVNHISVMADEETLDTFRKVALGGKELVSLSRAPFLKDADPGTVAGAVLFEWGMAQAVAARTAEEIRRLLTDDQLTINGNRYTPNLANIEGFLSVLGESWKGIQQILQAA